MPQAIGLLDDLDKELNTYAMRVREWYGWHFPELQKVLVDNLAYANVVRLAGFRTNISYHTHKFASFILGLLGYGACSKSESGMVLPAINESSSEIQSLR